jgi:hypothetical protein
MRELRCEELRWNYIYNYIWNYHYNEVHGAVQYKT